MGDRFPHYELVLLGGRVVDPETGLDELRNVGVSCGRIAAITVEPITGADELDARGKIVAPGFIDMHSHGQGIAEQRLQAFDGVTTALELECGAFPVASAYARSAVEKRVIHYGFSTAWMAVRMQVAGMPPDVGGFDDLIAGIAREGWKGRLGAAGMRRMLGALECELRDGALGVGLPIGYASRIEPEEVQAVAAAAAAFDAPVFVHARDLREHAQDGLIDGIEEVVGVALATGAHIHVCHVHSSSRQHLRRALAEIAEAQEEGARLTTEAYPYDTGMTAIGAEFLAPERLALWGIEPTSDRKSVV